MYLRTVRVKKKDKVLEYVQLAHSHRDPVTRKPGVKVLYNLGRADRLDMDALRRLVRSISRFLEPGEARAIRERLGEELPFEFLGSKQVGGAWLALLLIRVAENETGQTWRRLTQVLGSLQVSINATPAGEVWQTNPVTAEGKGVFDTLGVKPPPRYYALPTPRPNRV